MCYRDNLCKGTFCWLRSRARVFVQMRALCVGVHAGRPRPLPHPGARGSLPALLPQVSHDGSHHLCQPGIPDPGVPALALVAARLLQ